MPTETHLPGPHSGRAVNSCLRFRAGTGMPLRGTGGFAPVVAPACASMTPGSRTPLLKRNGRRDRNGHTFAPSEAVPLVAAVERSKATVVVLYDVVSPRVGPLACSRKVAQYRARERNRNVKAALRGNVLA